MLEDRKKRVFRKNLYDWHATINRDMPWKETKDPYKIWISEIVLQQTRVEQGRGYYERLVDRFPDVKSLAAATVDEVLAMWKGLGYYTRAHNLHKAAKMIMGEHNGQFPSTHEDILSLPGIGPYAAAAIASFAYDLPYAVLDGNVYRVLSRYLDIDTPIDTTPGRKQFIALSQMLLDENDPARYNQAIMDFGALMCKPSVPLCMECPLIQSCQGYQNGVADLLPVKSKKVKVKKRYFHYLSIISERGIILEKRGKNDIWNGLYELPMIEGPKRLSKKEVLQEARQIYGAEIKIRMHHSATQRLTHRLIHGDFYKVDGVSTISQYKWVRKEDIYNLGLPKIIDDYLNMYVVPDQNKTHR